MKADPIKLVRFLEGGDKKFSIPIYQRAYAWGKLECKQFFDDILNIHKNNLSGHFIGSIVSIRSLQEYPVVYSVIDGQQRLVSTFLLMKALIDLVKKEYTSFQDQIKIEQLISYLKDVHSEDNIKLKLRASNKDQEVLLKLFEEEDEEYYKSNKEHNIIRNYQYFYSRLSDLIKEDALLGFSKAIRELDIINITLEENKDRPQVIFESLNATGLKLRKSDLMRNRILMDFPINKQEDLFNKYWQSIEENCQGNADDFLWCYLISMETRKISKEDLYTAFKNYFFYKNKQDIEEELKKLKEYSVYYKYILEPNSTKFNHNIKIYLSHIYSIAETSKFFLLPLLASYLKGENYIKNEKNLQEILYILRNFLVRRAIVASNIGMNSLFIMLHNKIIEQKKDYLNTMVNILIHKGIYYVGNFPEDADFKKALQDYSRNFYAGNTSKNTKHMLYALQYSKNFKEAVDIKKFQIEHIIPQKLNKKWEKILGDSKEHSKYLNSLGNLTLTLDNQELSNKSYDNKKEIFLKSNCNILNLEIIENDSWSYPITKSRGKRLAEEIVKNFAYPSNVGEKIEFIKTNVSKETYKFTFDSVDEEELTGVKIKSFSYKGSSYDADSMAEMIRILIKEELYMGNEDIFIPNNLELIKHEEDFSNNPNYNYSKSNLLDNGFYINIHTGNKTRVKFLKQMFAVLKLDEEDLEIEILNQE